MIGIGYYVHVFCYRSCYVHLGESQRCLLQTSEPHYPATACVVETTQARGPTIAATPTTAAGSSGSDVVYLDHLVRTT